MFFIVRCHEARIAASLRLRWALSTDAARPPDKTTEILRRAGRAVIGTDPPDRNQIRSLRRNHARNEVSTE